MKKKNIKLFIIEDNTSIQKMLIEIIEKNIPNSEISTFASVERALGNINENPDYIILDHFLEKTNGIDCIPLFKEFMPDAKIIVVSSQNDIQVFENAFIYGANEYFRKDALFPLNIVDYIKEDIENNNKGWFQTILDESFKIDKNKNSKKIIYVLDDNLNSSFSIEHILQNESVNEVFSFNHTKDFYFQLKLLKPDYVVLDYNIEETINGGDVLREIMEVSAKTKVIIFSNQTDVATANKLLKMGATLYLSKSNENLKKLKTIIN